MANGTNLGQRLAFKHVSLVQDEEDYRRLLELSRSPSVCRRVQRLTCYSADFEAGRMPERFAASRCIDGKDRTQETFNDADKDCQCQQPLEDGNVDIASVATALRRFHRLCSIEIVRDLSHLEETWYYVDSLFTYSQAGQRLLKAITSALFVSELGLEELSLGYFDKHCPSLIGINQNLAPARLGIYQQAFGNLKRLKMLLPWIVHDEDGGYTNELNCAGILALIQSAPLLEELRLRVDMHGSEPLAPDYSGVSQTPQVADSGIGLCGLSRSVVLSGVA
jgi:hypothetical protein